ncbi:hypothetical protein E2C01_041684 [Portunus trituberculatus]|uniref:Uncharacterized protein n=1 Tax=Portunus trituberculatus TaxID=210409 RepID=A0A5B7FSD4_PORTR|nr:hypothetical protein [Portunus trituberculatus]
MCSGTVTRQCTAHEAVGCSWSSREDSGIGYGMGIAHCTQHTPSLTTLRGALAKQISRRQLSLPPSRCHAPLALALTSIYINFRVSSANFRTYDVLLKSRRCENDSVWPSSFASMSNTTNTTSPSANTTHNSAAREEEQERSRGAEHSLPSGHFNRYRVGK